MEFQLIFVLRTNKNPQAKEKTMIIVLLQYCFVLPTDDGKIERNEIISDEIR